MRKPGFEFKSIGLQHLSLALCIEQKGTVWHESWCAIRHLIWLCLFLDRPLNRSFLFSCPWSSSDWWKSPYAANKKDFRIFEVFFTNWERHDVFIDSLSSFNDFYISWLGFGCVNWCIGIFFFMWKYLCGYTVSGSLNIILLYTILL